MSRRRKVALSLVLLALLAGFVAIILRPDPNAAEQKSVRAWTLELNAAQPDVREAAASALKSLGPKAVPELVAMLNERNPRLKRTILDVSRHLPRPLRRPIWRRFHTPDAVAVHGMAAKGLGLLGPEAKDAIPALNRTLRNPDGYVTWEAANALGRIGVEAVPVLMANLQDTNKLVRRASVFALGVIGPPAVKSFPDVLRAASEPDPGMRSSVIGSLRGMDPAYAERLAAIITDGPADLRELAMNVLPGRSYFAVSALPALMKLARDDDIATRQLAIHTLGRIQPWNAQSFARLVQALDDPSPDIRVATTNLLDEANAATAMPALALQETARHESPAVREWTARWIGHLESPEPETLATLEVLLADEQPSVREAAQEAQRLLREHVTSAQPTQEMTE